MIHMYEIKSTKNKESQYDKNKHYKTIMIQPDISNLNSAKESQLQKTLIEKYDSLDIIKLNFWKRIKSKK